MTPIHRQLKVLLIEDNESDVFITLRHLKQHWTEVKHLQVDSIDKLTDALQADWDVILCDFNLPGFDGMTALRIVIESGIHTPFILVSGEVPEEVATLLMRLGANDYVMKNNLARLVPAILRELRYRDAHTQKVVPEPEEKKEKLKPLNALNKLLPPITPEGSKTVTERHRAIINMLFVSEFIRKHQSIVLEKENLTLPRLNILRILRRISPGGISISAIKDEMIYKTVDLSRMIDKMNREGLVNASKNKQAKEIEITARGLDALNTVDKYDEEMFLPENYLSEENAKQINEALQETLCLIK